MKGLVTAMTLVVVFMASFAMTALGCALTVWIGLRVLDWLGVVG